MCTNRTNRGLEVEMSGTQESTGSATEASGPAAVPLRFEVVVLPVADVDRAKDFYQRLGWRFDIDLVVDEGYRVVQFTPPDSPTSIQFGTGLTSMAPGSIQDLYLIVEDIEAARDELIARGAEVSGIWHGRGLGTVGHEPGIDPERASYRSFASFSDPDGNSWLLQEITERLPGRGGSKGIAGLAQLLHETSVHHGAFEAVAPPHDWWDWYAAYAHAREGGSTEAEASAAAGRYMAQVKHVVVEGN
jgi:catechol 2,3-dioxygenase-like lactoylglutathione lyase family enzyme